ncbi:methylated-DNA--[protein]-cysteine S-methyltransferase [Siphonobacter curvatus]|uniref:Methylated-DNA--protein-cysteine methyltransferase n=1 Tax=Siphonobacter curvatus TaxID=2094562 RepID=A0A2S7IT26_9BACT|nr:methylated-DNA--[protein]-cysteine S-methyltransferase [Siphonobacter curvatus]PQA60854.1 cysteine methyltransferase [Siphonobacter curvatus]
MTTSYKTIPSPVGLLTLVASQKGLAAILWQNDRPERVSIVLGSPDEQHPVLLETQQQLKEYFAGKRKTFTLPLDFIGTDFQKQVWQALLTIPYGQTRTYGEIAQQLGNPQAVRAVGGAANRNPISIVAPCHRVVGASGKLVGFAGGLIHKNRLLRLEGAIAQTSLWE